MLERKRGEKRIYWSELLKYMDNLREIRVILNDGEYASALKKKGTRTWRECLLSTLDTPFKARIVGRPKREAPPDE